MMFRLSAPGIVYDVEAENADNAKSRFQAKFGYYPYGIEVSEIELY